MRYLVTVLFAALTECAFLLPSATAQSPRQDSSIQSAENYATGIYGAYIGNQSPAYNGVGYNRYDPLVIGSPFFRSASVAPGSVVYDGVQYTNMPMQYDLVYDQLVFVQKGGYQVSLFMNKVTEFTLLGHHFLHNSKGSYDQLLSGTISIVARRTKNINDSIGTSQVEHVIHDKDYFYAIRGGIYYELPDERHLLTLMNDRRKDVKDFIRKNKIRFSRNPEYAILTIAGFYNQLSR